MNLELLIGWIYKPLYGYTLVDYLMCTIEISLLLCIIYGIGVLTGGILKALEEYYDKK